MKFHRKSQKIVEWFCQKQINRKQSSAERILETVSKKLDLLIVSQAKVVLQND